MSDAVAEYQSAVEELKQARAVCEKLSKVIYAAGIAMSGENWRTVIVSNADVSFPESVANPRRVTIDAREWPSGHQIAEALAKYHSAKQAVLIAYDNIPEAEQAGVKTLDMS